MANCNFSILFSEPAQSLVTRAESGITGAKGMFEGDANEGIFKVPTPLGSIEGIYVIADSAITITIKNKPMLLSCSRIETELTKFLT